MKLDEQLKNISSTLASGIASSPVTVRELLSWIGAQRRGTWVVEQIQEALERHKLRTVPDFIGTYIDSEIVFEKFTPVAKNVQPGPCAEEAIDPTYRIGRLSAANRPPIRVKPDDPLNLAVTLMLTNDISQLPVMSADDDVNGVISWHSVGSRIAIGKKCLKVRDCMDKCVEISADLSLFDAIDQIISAQYVLVRTQDNKISGIVTTSDLSLQFQQLGEPFLLIGEIENYLRRLMKGRYTIEELNEAKNSYDSKRVVKRIADLTFGEYKRLLEKPERWEKLGLQLDRKEFIGKLECVRQIRNDVMHFDPDGIPETDLKTLREFVCFFQKLADMKAI